MPSVSEISGCIRQERRKGGNVFHFYGGASRRRRRKPVSGWCQPVPKRLRPGNEGKRYFFPSCLQAEKRNERKRNQLSSCSSFAFLARIFHDGTAISFRYFHGVAAIVAGHGGQGPSYVAHVENRQFPGGRLFRIGYVGKVGSGMCLPVHFFVLDSWLRSMSNGQPPLPAMVEKLRDKTRKSACPT